MSDFSFLAVPNIEGMRFLWYLKVVGIVLLFGVSLFFVIYFRIKLRRGKELFRQMEDFDYRAQELEHQLFVDRIHKSSGKKKLVLFIEYLEKFVTTKAPSISGQVYANISELLCSQGFTAKEADECEQTLYASKKLPAYISSKIDEALTKIAEK